MDQDELNALFQGQMEYENSFQHSSPSANYFWWRKRDQLKRLFIDNQHLFKQTGSHEAVFVDLGCYSGLDMFLLRDLCTSLNIPFARWIGIDGAPTGAALFDLRKRWKEATNVDFIRHDIAKPLPLGDGSIDVLFSSEVFEHIPDPKILGKEIARVLRPGGYFILTTPNQPNVFQKLFWRSSRAKELKEWREKVLASPERVDFDGSECKLYGHVSLHTNQEWDRLFQSCGFDLVDYRRGAVRYGGAPKHDQASSLALTFTVEAVLDCLPRKLTRNLSDEVIALYRKAKP